MLPDMYDILTEGVDMAGALRVDRSGEALLRSFFSDMLVQYLHKVSTTTIVPGARDFRLMTRTVVEAIDSMTERNRFTQGLYCWVGLQTQYSPYRHIERTHGTTSWSFPHLLRYESDGNFDFSDAPSTFVSIVGNSSYFGAYFAHFYFVVRAALFGDPTSGWP